MLVVKAVDSFECVVLRYTPWNDDVTGTWCCRALRRAAESPGIPLCTPLGVWQRTLGLVAPSRSRAPLASHMALLHGHRLSCPNTPPTSSKPGERESSRPASSCGPHNTRARADQRGRREDREIEKQKGSAVTIEDIRPLVAGTQNRRVLQNGEMDAAPGVGGMVAGLIPRHLPPARKLIERIVAEAEMRSVRGRLLPAFGS